jgi:Spy/CpxP family protein refolding chaperone
MVIDLEADIVALHDAEPAPRTVLAGMIRSAQLDGVELQRIYTARREQVDRLAEKVIDQLVEFHALLTPEQREILATKLENHHNGRRCRFFQH